MIEKNTKILFLFSVALLALVVLEIAVILSFIGNVSMPLFDSIGIFLLLSSLLLLSTGAAFMSWTRRFANLTHWVLALWWSFYTAEAVPVTWVGDSTLDLSLYLLGENLRYSIGFILSVMAVVYLAIQALGLLRTEQTLASIGRFPFIAAIVVFLPWFGIDFLNAAKEEIFPISNIEPTLFFLYSLIFLCVLLYDWFTDIHDKSG